MHLICPANFLSVNMDNYFSEIIEPFRAQKEDQFSFAKKGTLFDDENFLLQVSNISALSLHKILTDTIFTCFVVLKNGFHF